MLNKKKNFDDCEVSINSQEDKSEIYAVTIRISMIEYHNNKLQFLWFILTLQLC